MLLAKGIAQDTLDNCLRVVQGDVRDAAAVTSTLVRDGNAATFVLSGIGMIPGWNADTRVCQDATRSILDALRALRLPTDAPKPFMVAISTTGITSGPRDVPLLFMPLYHVALAAPHRDKRVMEDLVTQADQEGGPVSGFCLPRPSLLTSGTEPGTVRVGSEEAPAVGYTISRNDVGKWIFEQCIMGDAHSWSGKKPTLTY